MQKIYTDLNLDFQEGRSLTAAHVTQGDKSGGRVLRIALYNGGQRVDLNSETDTVSLLASVGNTITAAGHSLTITDNMVRVPIMDELTQLSGVEHCTVRVESTNGRVHTARFDLIVDRSPISPDMPEIISTADLVDRVDAIETTSHDFVKNYLLSSFRTVHPEYTYVVRSNTEVQGGAGTHFCLIPKTVFDPAVDGIMIWTDLYLIQAYLYEFDTITDPDNVIVNFVQSADFYIDENDDVVDIHIFQKSPIVPQTIGTSAVYTPLGVMSATIGTTYTDLTPQLKSVTDTSDAARSSVNLGRLCTNVGGVCVIFVMHRCAVSISDGTGGTWTQINVSHTAQYEDAGYDSHEMSIFWRTVSANVPLTVTVTGTASQRLYASAVIYEGKSTVTTVERTNEATYETLYFNTSEQTDGLVSSPTASASSIDIWCLTVEYLNNYWCKALDTTYDPSDAEVSHPDSGETNRLAIYAGGGTRFIAYADESKQCKSYLGFYINRNVITNADFESAVQFLHVTVS